ncbi:MAG: YigZ family protein [Erysipelotrichaceae bacterium]|nr:YigZ family protein [Erysipelotrichaceae bacterium]MBO4537552.1 YigZ family protein [Erysipelotrichaceae bacterium]
MYHIKERTESQIEVKKSRFIGILLPVSDEGQIREHLNAIRRQFPGARHYCYGAVIEGNNRSNDDGEPASTAGKPILEALKNRDLDNVLCVVVRYFGGTLLGTAGLIKAYGQCASLAIDQAVLTVPTEVLTCYMSVDYSLTSKAEHLLQNNAEILERQYGEKMTYIFASLRDLSELIHSSIGYNVDVEILRSEIRDLDAEPEE